MEVEVAPPSRVGRRVSLVTDIDVLAIVPDPVLGEHSVLFDCKTKAAESGANRSLWLKGLMAHFGADQAFCVLKKSGIEPDHRYVAQDLGVVLIPESEFESFARVSAGSELTTDAAVSSIDVWEEVAGLRRKFPALGPLLDYRAGEFWRARSTHAGCRKVVANTLEHRAEFDPSHPQHEVLFGDLASLFALTVSSLVASIFRTMLLPNSAAEFGDAVKMKIYGGREEYEQQNKLFKLLKQSRHGAKYEDDLAPPEWTRFTKLLRQLLDDPNAALRAALILKECAFSLLVPSSNYLQDISRADPQAVRFGILMADYFSRATRVPPEFGKRLESRLLALA
ncbi:hypothetical protein BGP89_14215 [Luteimonas sp. JM171]|uniref:hypothetical protein n=1 Tax=Luteimonas sp. JM171 TaxID=1896164 RepID=UPI0012FBC877|nr:hypothetical protein [Luteimonas sp. JM171]